MCFNFRSPLPDVKYLQTKHNGNVTYYIRNGSSYNECNLVWFDHFSNASQKFHISNEGLFTNNNL